jgi:hypothetical protein
VAKDPGDDWYIDAVVKQINAAAVEGGFTEKEKVELVIAFVRSLPCTVDQAATPWNEYPRYPVETLFDRGGDCEDTSILVAALLDRMGYDTALQLLHREMHAAVGYASWGPAAPTTGLTGSSASTWRRPLTAARWGRSLWPSTS